MTNVAAKNILSSVAIQSSETSVLLLDCPDITSILKTVEHNSSPPCHTPPNKAMERNGGADIGAHRQPESFDFHVNNSNPVALARIVLLLVLASTHGIEESEGVDLFWAIWSNSLLTRLQHERFKALSQRLAMHDFSPYLSSQFNFPLNFPDYNDLESVTSVWKAWAVCKNLTSAKLVSEMRLKVVTTSLAHESEAYSGKMNVIAL